MLFIAMDESRLVAMKIKCEGAFIRVRTMVPGDVGDRLLLLDAPMRKKEEEE